MLYDENSRVEIMISQKPRLRLTRNIKHRTLYQYAMSNRGEIRALFVYSYGTILPSCNSEKEPVKTVLHRCSNKIYEDG